MNPATKRRMRTAHAKHPHHCSCGKVVFGNGGAYHHFAMHERKRDGFGWINSADFDKRWPLYGRCTIAGCMYRQAGDATKEGSLCDEHAADVLRGALR